MQGHIALLALLLSINVNGLRLGDDNPLLGLFSSSSSSSGGGGATAANLPTFNPQTEGGLLDKGNCPAYQSYDVVKITQWCGELPAFKKSPVKASHCLVVLGIGTDGGLFSKQDTKDIVMELGGEPYKDELHDNAIVQRATMSCKEFEVTPSTLAQSSIIPGWDPNKLEVYMPTTPVTGGVGRKKEKTVKALLTMIEGYARSHPFYILTQTNCQTFATSVIRQLTGNDWPLKDELKLAALRRAGW